MDKSIITKAYELMLQTKLTYQQIATGTGLNLGWVQHYCQRCDKGQDFHAMKVERLISFLGGINEMKQDFEKLMESDNAIELMDLLIEFNEKHFQNNLSGIAKN